MWKEGCGNLDSRYKRLVSTLELSGKFDTVIPLPNQCRQIEVLSSWTYVGLVSKQLHFRLIYYTRIITNIVSNIIISSENFKKQKLLKFYKTISPNNSAFSSLNMNNLFTSVGGSSKISCLLHTYSSVTFHFWSRNNIKPFLLHNIYSFYNI
jgi:hypothetical protein